MLHSMKNEKEARVAVIDLQTLEIKTHEAEEESLNNFLDDQDALCKTSRKRQKRGDVFSGLHQQYVGVASRGPKFVPDGSASKTS